MVFINEYDVSDIIAAISALIVVVVGFFALFKWKKAVNIQRTEYINELMSKTRADEEISEVIQMFEYNMPWYCLAFHGSENEKRVDKTLSYFSYICYLKKGELLQRKNLSFLNMKLSICF